MRTTDNRLSLWPFSNCCEAPQWLDWSIKSRTMVILRSILVDRTAFIMPHLRNEYLINIDISHNALETSQAFLYDCHLQLYRARNAKWFIQWTWQRESFVLIVIVSPNHRLNKIITTVLGLSCSQIAWADEFSGMHALLHFCLTHCIAYRRIQFRNQTNTPSISRTLS